MAKTTALKTSVRLARFSDENKKKKNVSYVYIDICRKSLRPTFSDGHGTAEGNGVIRAASDVHIPWV